MSGWQMVGWTVMLWALLTLAAGYAFGQTQPTGPCCVLGPVVNVAHPIYWAIAVTQGALGWWLRGVLRREKGVSDE